MPQTWRYGDFETSLGLFPDSANCSDPKPPHLKLPPTFPRPLPSSLSPRLCRRGWRSSKAGGRAARLGGMEVEAAISAAGSPSSRSSLRHDGRARRPLLEEGQAFALLPSEGSLVKGK